MFKAILSSLVLVFCFVSSSFGCETLPLLQIITPSQSFECDGALYDTTQNTITFEIGGRVRTISGKFQIATADGEVTVENGHLVLHPSQLDQSISVVLPEDQRYGLINLSEELLDAVANTYGYGTMPHRDLRAYLNAHPEEVIPELN